jgi:hypothetical protein
MVNSRRKVDLRRLEGIIRGEMDVQEEDTTSIGRVIGTHDSSLPMILILLINGTSRAVGRWVFAEVDEFLLNSLKSRH